MRDRLPGVAPSDPVLDDEMTLRRVREICNGFEGTDESELQNRPLFHLARRRFAIFNGRTSPPRPRWHSSGRSLHFVTDPLERDALREDGRFTASPHHGDRGWFAMSLEQPESLDWGEIAELLESAYRHVAPQHLLGH